MRAHALLSASSAERWLHCPPSARLTEKIKDEGSHYAREGTLAHELAERLIRAELGEKIKPLSKTITDSPYYYEGMAVDVEEYVSYVLETYRAAGKSADIELEQRLDFSAYVPSGFGTGDCVIIADGEIEVIDLKFGKGVGVEAVENSQLMLYGLGALLAYDFIYDIKTVRMTIVQPRREHIDTYELSAEMLLEWAEETVKPMADLAYAGKGELSAGSWCRWCKIKQTCKHRAETMMQTVSDFRGKELTADEVAEVLEQSKAIASWLTDIEEHALNALLTGDSIPGWKAVEGRSNRKISDPEALASSLIEKGYGEDKIYKPQELQTLTNLEKIVGKKTFGEDFSMFILKPPGKPTLAKETDKRPALGGVETEFDFEDK